MEISWLRKALENIDDIYHYLLVNANENLAQQVVNHIYRSVNRLKTNPALGRAGRIPGTRELVLARYDYVIPYRVYQQQIQILRVFHTRQTRPLNG